jgi:hypothetical protein
MPARKQIPPNEKLPLNLTSTERKLILELLCLDDEYVRLLRDLPTSQPVMMTLDELEDFGDYVAAEADHCNSKKQKSLDTVFEKIQKLLDTHTDEPLTINILDARQSRIVSVQAVQIAEWTGQALVAAKQMGIKRKPLAHFQLAPAQREILLLVPEMTNAVTKKLAKDDSSFTVSDVAGMILALAEDLTGDARKQVAVLLVARDLADQLQMGLADFAKPKLRKKVDKSALFQFKITLLGVKPPIWRRIQVQDCTLDRLHEHIQTAMSWTNSHLHQFEINGLRYGNPELFDDDYDCVDSTETLLSALLPEPFAFCYEYDFGDGWKHEILFEGRPPLEPGARYPTCLEGKRACPPEDCGGVWGYRDLLSAIADPKHVEHERMLEWCGGFLPDVFDPAKATRRMRKGLPNWRTR